MVFDNKRLLLGCAYRLAPRIAIITYTSHYGMSPSYPKDIYPPPPPPPKLHTPEGPLMRSGNLIIALPPPPFISTGFAKPRGR